MLMSMEFDRNFSFYLKKGDKSIYDMFCCFAKKEIF